jgi:hypothetical protein
VALVAADAHERLLAALDRIVGRPEGLHYNSRSAGLQARRGDDRHCHGQENKKTGKRGSIRRAVLRAFVPSCQ